MIEFTFYYSLAGFILCLQHSVRYYLINKKALKLESYKNTFDYSKLFYLMCVFVWPLALDMLLDVADYNRD